MKKSIFLNGKLHLPDGNDLSDVHADVVHLGNEQRRNGFIESGAVHVNGGPHRNDKAADPGVNVVVVFQALQRHGHCGRTAQTRRTHLYVLYINIHFEYIYVMYVWMCVCMHCKC